MQLLERADALAALREYAADARSGAGRVVLVSGEAGVGKSVLVDELRSTTPELVWGAGACDGLFTPRPLGPLFEIAQQLGGELLEACRRDASRDELFATLLRQLSESATPTALLVEDAH